MSDEKSSQGWWTSLPGVLTASAAAITAIGGLIAVIGQQGLFHKSAPETPAVVASAPVVAPSPANTVAAKDVAATPAAQTQTVSAPASAPAVPASLPASLPASRPLTPGNIGSNMTYFTGNWQNINPAATGILKIQVRIADATLYVRAWAKCRPTDCDWGEVQAEGIGTGVGTGRGTGMREVTAQFHNNVRQVALTIHPAPNNHIRVEALYTFIDQSGRAPLANVYVFQRM